MLMSNQTFPTLSFAKPIFLFLSFFSAITSVEAQTTDVYTTSATWTVPAAVSTISVKVYGGAGGTGGQDCGAGCTNPAGGPVGYVVAIYTVTPGDAIGIYPGGKGVNGSNSVTNTGGGAGGADTYPLLNFNGGTGGNAGNSGSSGGGGGGGAASVVTINSAIVIVAGGAGGGGGMANLAGSGQDGSSSASSNGTNTGGNGTQPAGDGGGGAGSGGGQFASAGGGVHAAGGENAGNGGFIGGNAVTGASSVTTNANISWAAAGQIEITYSTVLPVTWLNFTASRQNTGIKLHWTTASEQNTRDYIIQQSANGRDWKDIGTVPGAGNSSAERQYDFLDPAPFAGLNYYRLEQRDIDNRINYSKTISVDFSKQGILLKIYPNPLVNKALIFHLQETATIAIYSSVGTLVMKRNIAAGDHRLDLSFLANGTYYIRVKNESVLFLLR
jgi:Secretion system C-terminal sorting domain